MTSHSNQEIRDIMADPERSVDLHTIHADLPCDICGMNMADVVVQLSEYDLKAYHLVCLEDNQ